MKDCTRLLEDVLIGRNELIFLKKDSKLTRILYDLKKDPYELTNIVEANPKIATEMENFVEKIKKEAHSDNSEQISKEEEEKITEELKKLGYI